MWLIIACVLFLVANVAQAKKSWHSMTQAERNQSLVERATKDIGKNTRMLCGKWVEKIVLDVSRSYYTPVHISFGQRYPNANRYDTSTNIVRVTENGNFPIEKAQAGWIVWYRTKEGESRVINKRNIKVGGVPNNQTEITTHVMIIKSVSKTGIEVIDCNCVATTTVGTYSLSFREFYDRVMTVDGKKEYYLYYVL
jgi:hypothetical protein